MTGQQHFRTEFGIVTGGRPLDKVDLARAEAATTRRSLGCELSLPQVPPTSLNRLAGTAMVRRSPSEARIMTVRELVDDPRAPSAAPMQSPVGRGARWIPLRLPQAVGSAPADVVQWQNISFPS